MSEETEIRFEGVPSTPSDDDLNGAREAIPLWARLIEDGINKYASNLKMAEKYEEPKEDGATLEQAWNAYTSSGVERHLILARSVPEDQIEKIPHVTRCSPEEHIEFLKKLKSSIGELNTPTLHYDGKTGNCIRITDYDKKNDRFIYQDPRPGGSLLTKEKNMADVDAKEDGKYWSVTSKELKKVVYASFLLPHQWARLQGKNFDLMYDKWNNSVFYKHFNLKQLEVSSEQKTTSRILAPLAFKENVSIIVDSQDNGKIIKASLILNKSWIIDNFILALDISKGFIESFAPAPDSEIYNEISRAIWHLQNPNYILSMEDEDPDKSITARCVNTYMGSIRTASMNTDFGKLSFTNVKYNNKDFQKIEFTLF
jgi:hypothetical protein